MDSCFRTQPGTSQVLFDQGGIAVQAQLQVNSHAVLGHPPSPTRLELLSGGVDMIDAHEIVPGLWQGSKPKSGGQLASYGFSTLVFCAREYQPSSVYFPGMHLIHAPFEDENWLVKETLQLAVRAASEIAIRFGAKEKILVTCLAGINRSGFVVALALHKIFGYSGRSCIDLVRAGRKLEDDTALRNPAFVEALMKLPGKELIVLPGLSPLCIP